MALVLGIQRRTLPNFRIAAQRLRSGRPTGNHIIFGLLAGPATRWTTSASSRPKRQLFRPWLRL